MGSVVKIERLRTCMTILHVCQILGRFTFLLQTAWIFAWDFQFIQTTLPNLFFLFFKPDLCFSLVELFI